MATCPKSSLIKSYERVGLQQEGIMPSRRLGVYSVELPHYSSTDVNMMTSAHVLAVLPNQSFISAIDITRIGEINMLMDRRVCAEDQAMLDDQESFMALSAKLIADLIDKEPDTGRLPDVKVRFR